MNSTFNFLLYHGVTKNKNSNSLINYNNKHELIDNFENQCELIAKNYIPISIDDFLKYDCNKNKKEKYICVTFDDGFRNNYTNALPILEKYKIPATFYISTGMIDTENIFWVDEIELLVENMDKDKVKNILSELLNYEFESQSKEFILQKSKSILKEINLCQRLEIVKQISSYREQFGWEIPEDYKPATWKQIKEINSNSLFTVGGHCVMHEVMSTMSNDELKFVINKSIQSLRKNLGSFSGHYAYPEGGHQHFSERDIQLLKENGVKCCPTAIPGINFAGDDPFKLKRNMVNFKYNGWNFNL